MGLYDNQSTLKDLIKRFPFKYVGGGYFRDQTILKGKAEILHGDDVISRFAEFAVQTLQNDLQNNLRGGQPTHLHCVGGEICQSHGATIEINTK